MKKKPETQNQEFDKIMSKSTRLFLLGTHDEKINRINPRQVMPAFKNLGRYSRILWELLKIEKVTKAASTQWYKILVNQKEEDIEKQITKNFSTIFYEEINSLYSTTEETEKNNIYECPICKETFKEPHIMNQTGQIYCANCIEIHLVHQADRKTDPMTNEELLDVGHKKCITKISELSQHKDSFLERAMFLLKIYTRNAELFFKVDNEDSLKKLPVMFWMIEKCLSFKKGHLDVHECAEQFFALCKRKDEEGFYKSQLDEFCKISFEYCKLLDRKDTNLLKKKRFEKTREVLDRRDQTPIDMMIDLYELMLATGQSSVGEVNEQPFAGVNPRRCQDVIELMLCYQGRDGDERALLRITEFLVEAPDCIAWLQFRARADRSLTNKSKTFCKIGDLWLKNEVGDEELNQSEAIKAFRDSNEVVPNIECLKGLIKIYSQQNKRHKVPQQYFRISKLLEENDEKIEMLMLGWKAEPDNKVILRRMLEIFANGLKMEKIDDVCDQLSGMLKLEMQNYALGKMFSARMKIMDEVQQQNCKVIANQAKEISDLKAKTNLHHRWQTKLSLLDSLAVSQLLPPLNWDPGKITLVSLNNGRKMALNNQGNVLTQSGPWGWCSSITKQKFCDNRIVYYEVKILKSEEKFGYSPMIGWCDGKRLLQAEYGGTTGSYRCVWYGFGYMLDKQNTQLDVQTKEKFTTGDVVGTLLDLRGKGTISFFKNGKLVDEEVLTVKGVKDHNKEFFPVVSMYNSVDVVALRSGKEIPEEHVKAVVDSL